MPSSANRWWSRRCAWTAALVLLAAVLTPSTRAQTSNPGDLYKEALAREALLRKELAAHRPPEPTTPLLRRVRVMVGAYADIARLFPTSGYSDNALWQGGLLSADAFWRFGDGEDRDTALQFLEALVARFPTSSLVRQVPPHLTRLQNARAEAPSVPAAAASVRVAASAPPVEAPTAPAAAADPDAPVTLSAIRREVLPNALRITLELDREVPFHEERLDGPPRVFVDLQNTRAAEALKDATIPFADDLVQQIRVGRQLDARTRVVMDLNGITPYSVYALYNPYRVVIDFERRPPVREAAQLPPLPPAPPLEPAVVSAAVTVSRVAPAAPAANSTGGFSLSRQLGLGVARVVIDPGHGGHDPGAKVQGLTEANLVLDVALRLEKLLQKEKNVEVVLTRRTNAYVPLEERTAIANRSGADLFLSIHANASAAASARGIETYFLNFAANPEAEAIAARENAASARSMRDLPNIVEAIALNNKLNESRDFATIMQATLYERLRKVNRNVRNLGVKQAPFIVLIGAGMPSILAEISFMTNRQEAALLKTEKYRQQIAEALLAGVMAYQQSLKKTPAVAATR